MFPVTFSHTFTTICSQEIPVKWCWHWAPEAHIPICSLAFLECVALLKPPTFGMPRARRHSRWRSYSESCAHFTHSNTWKVYRGLVLPERNWCGRHRAIHTLRSKFHQQLHNAPSLWDHSSWSPGCMWRTSVLSWGHCHVFFINTNSISGILVHWVFFHLGKIGTVEFGRDSKAMLNFSANFSKWTMLFLRQFSAVHLGKSRLHWISLFTVLCSSPSPISPHILPFSKLLLLHRLGIWDHFITFWTQEYY